MIVILNKNTSYTVIVSGKNHLTNQRIFNINGENKLIKFTYMFETTNLNVDIDLARFDSKEEISFQIIPHDEYTNRNYFPSNEVNFKNPDFKRPIVIAEVFQNHSEHGTLKIKYEHEGIILKDGQYVEQKENSEEYRVINPNDYNALVSIYPFVGNEFKEESSIKNIKLKLGETKDIVINFEDISPGFRSCKIYYFLVIKDLLYEIYNTTILPSEINDIETETNLYHYYNDEPYDPEPCIGECNNEDDRHAYNYAYTNIECTETIEPDGDGIIYFLYINTPFSLEEKIKTFEINNRKEKVKIEYTRKYKLVVKDPTIVLENTLDVVNQYGSKLTEVYYIDEENNKEIYIQTFKGIGMTIDYMYDHLGKTWPILQEYTYYLVAIDDTGLENSYYGVSEMGVTFRERYDPPYEVELQVYDNLKEDGDSENGRIDFTYKHPRGNVDATIDIYAYQDGKYRGKVYTINHVSNNTTQTANINFRKFELLKGETLSETKFLTRKKAISYYAVATDEYIHKNSLMNFKNITIEDIPLFLERNQSIAKFSVHDAMLLYKNKDKLGRISEFILKYIEAILYPERNEFSLSRVTPGKMPKQTSGHYFNEEPPSTIVDLYDKSLLVYKEVKIKWELVTDPEGHNVNYGIYIGSNQNEALNIYSKNFYDYEEDREGKVYGEQGYTKTITIPSSMAEGFSKEFSVSTEEYEDDEKIKLWLITKDDYKNSYYRTSNLLIFKKAHRARPLRNVLPLDETLLYSQTPRIIVYLGIDDQTQTTYVEWNNVTYNNKDNPECFSNLPNTANITVFKPPIHEPIKDNEKFTFAAYAHNGVSFADKVYRTYTYRNFFNVIESKDFIPLKIKHINLFRSAINDTRKAYGLLETEFTRNIEKNMLFENYDFNESKDAMLDVNDFINNQEVSDVLDYKNPLIVDINDLELVEYKGIVKTPSYKEFIEWSRLIYILEDR